MLDLFRKKKAGLKWILWIVILGLGGSMLFLFVQTPGGVGVGPGNRDVAVVAGNPISLTQFRRRYNQVSESYGQILPLLQGDPEAIRQLNLGQQALDPLISAYAIHYGAQAMGIEATREEIREYITNLPLFQQNGQFIGTERYLQFLQANNRTPADFEDDMRREIVGNKLARVITDGIRATPEEVRQEFLESTEEIKIRYAAIDPETVAPETLELEDLRAYFEEQKENYRTPEQRKVKYVIFSVQTDEVELTEEQIQIRMASIAEKQEVRASHILLTLPSSDARQRGEEILDKLRAGADFGELAKEHSEDPATAANGGDVGFFGRGAMVPEFENAAFSLEPGEISDLVATNYGFHIIKVTEVHLVDSRALAESALRQEEGEKLAKNLAAKVAHEVSTGSNLETAAERYNLEIQESPFFSLGDVLPDLRVRNDFNQQVFTLSQGQTLGPYDQGGTDLVAQLMEIQPSALSEFEAVQDQVTRDLKLSRGEDIARERAFAFAQALKEEPSFEKVAAREHLQVTTTDFFTRDASIDDELGYATEILSRAFRMNEDELSPALSVGGKYVVFQVAEKSTVDEEKFEQDKDELLLQITDEKKNRFFSAWVQNVISTLYEENKIHINQPLVDSIAGL